MSYTKGEWRIEAVSDAVRVVTGNGRQKLILARCATKQIPEAETTANARLMAAAPLLLMTLRNILDHGMMGGKSHDITICGCFGCSVRRLVKHADEQGWERRPGK